MKAFLVAALVALSAAAAQAQVAIDGAPLTKVEVAGQTILADVNGLTAYTFDIDKPNKSNCSGNCAVVWPPIVVESGTQVAAPFGTITRADGSLQLTWNEQPIYLFQNDKKPGDILGDGLQGVWHIIPLE